MAIGNLGSKISASDVDRVRDIQNPPEFQDGFEGGTGDDSMDDEFSFDDLDDFGSDSGESSGFGQPSSGGFGQPSSGGFGQPSGGFGGGGASNVFGNASTPFGGASTPFGGISNPFGGASNPFGNPIGGATQQPQQPPKKDAFDKAFDSSEQAFESMGHIIMELVKSLKNRNADDYGYLSRNMILTGIGFIVAGIIVGIIGVLTNVRFLTFQGLGVQFIGAGGLIFGTGGIGLSFSAFSIYKSADSAGQVSMAELPDISELESDDVTNDYEENIDDLFGELDDFDDSDTDTDEFDDISDKGGEDLEETFTPDNSVYETELNFDAMLNNVQENQLVNRQMLFETFKSFFPANTPGFTDKKRISETDELFDQLQTICIKALANVAKKELEEINTSIEEAYDGFFSYEIRLKRIKGVTRTSDIARELEVYFRESSTDYSVNASVDIEGDFYKIVVTKGVQAVITFGDILKVESASSYISNPKYELPIIAGISSYGEVIMANAKDFDTMVVTGKPRSGKSWYVLSLLFSLMVFNSPEDVQFIIIDPKESNLFNTIALMPHVAGLHSLDGEVGVLDILKDIIDNEGSRRAKLLKDNKCDDIWALREKGIPLPVLYIVIDEVMTIQSKLGDQFKDFLAMLKELISKLPYVGIRAILVPHRLTGLIDKTNRTMLHFAAAVKADASEVDETLNIKGWDIPLVNKGDIALKLNTRPDALFVKGPAVTSSDAKNTDLVMNVARAFYKMGVDLPDMTTLEVSCNRDEEYIRRELSITDANRIQYDASHVFDNLDDIEDF